MFTGIIEATGTIKKISREGSNLRMTIECTFANELKVDQSVSHNGVCLTVVSVNGNTYDVVAIDETLKRSNLGSLKEGGKINLERCVKVGDRLDGHIVQGHVDGKATISKILTQNGSWIFHFTYTSKENITVEKGSICIDGISLTVVDSGEGSFSVAVIPYTFENTNLQSRKVGDEVNVEFDIVGKYVARLVRK